MKPHELKAAKRRVRRAVLARRDAMSAADRQDRSRRIHQRFLALPEVGAASTVSLFWSFGSEVATPPLIEALDGRGVRVLLPRIVGGDLELRAYRPGDELVETRFGAREPAGGEPVDPAEVDVIGTPAVAFDRSGGRIGYGGGYYDRLFVRAVRAARIGIAFAVQVVDEPLPAGHFDVRVDAVLTEEETLRWAR